MTLCCSALWGSPRGCPKGNRTYATLGGLIASATCLYIMVITVGIPCSSIALATSPTDRLHTGQVDARKAASIPASLRRLLTSGAVSLMRGSVSRMSPMKE